MEVSCARTTTWPATSCGPASITWAKPAGGNRGAPAPECIDSCGFPKDGYYFYQSQWTEKPVLHLFPHWNWKGREGQFLPVTCYTNCDTVELFLNGKSIGTKGFVFPRYGMQGRYGQYAPGSRRRRSAPPPICTSPGTCPTSPARCKAVGTKGGQNVPSKWRSRPPAIPPPSAFRWTATPSAPTAATWPTSTVKVLDAQGRLHPDADNEITFEIQGEGRLIGVDNGNMAEMAADFKGKTRKAFHGMCLAIVQSTGGAGTIRVTATSPGLKAATVTIAAKG